MGKGRTEALIILPDPMTNTHRAKIIEFASTKRLPTVFTERPAWPLPPKSWSWLQKAV
jgi:hypothetical protein